MLKTLISPEKTNIAIQGPHHMANLSLEQFTIGQGFSQIQVKGENMKHLVTAYHRKYVHLITFIAIISRHSTARAKRDMASSGQRILNSVHPKLQPTHTRAHRYKTVSYGVRRDTRYITEVSFSGM